MPHLITYISEHIGPPDSAATNCTAIITTSKAMNPLHDITGVLFFTRGKFLQVIEGPEEELRQLMRNIEGDARHTNMQYLIDTPVSRRGFSRWNMDFFRLEPGQSFDAETIKELTRSFETELLPRSDMLVLYYKALLERHEQQG